jgi:ribosome-associated protein
VLRAADRRIETLTPTVLEQAEIASLHPMQGSGEPDIGPLVRNVLHSLDDSKAEDIISIDLRGKTTLADVMVIATGRSNVHVGAIADRLLRSCKDAGLAIPHVEGMPHCDWVLIDAHDRRSASSTISKRCGAATGRRSAQACAAPSERRTRCDSF